MACSSPAAVAVIASARLAWAFPLLRVLFAPAPGFPSPRRASAVVPHRASASVVPRPFTSPPSPLLPSPLSPIALNHHSPFPACARLPSPSLHQPHSTRRIAAAPRSTAAAGMAAAVAACATARVGAGLKARLHGLAASPRLLAPLVGRRWWIACARRLPRARPPTRRPHSSPVARVFPCALPSLHRLPATSSARSPLPTHATNPLPPAPLLTPTTVSHPPRQQTAARAFSEAAGVGRGGARVSMALRSGIVGLTNVGKSTLFNALVSPPSSTPS
ncbi:unnamed protein product [Closterium sp. Naga37s-1]|nr:unnamed protein product [Closterium sp. Naga37s-1]